MATEDTEGSLQPGLEAAPAPSWSDPGLDSAPEQNDRATDLEAEKPERAMPFQALHDQVETLHTQLKKLLEDLQHAHHREPAQAASVGPSKSRKVRRKKKAENEPLEVKVESEKEDDPQGGPRRRHSHIGCPQRQQFGLSVEKLHALGTGAIDETNEDNKIRQDTKKFQPMKHMTKHLTRQVSKVSNAIFPPPEEVDKVHDPENWTEQLQKIMKGRDPALHYVRAGGRSILFKADVKPAQLSAEPASDDFPLVVISKIAEEKKKQKERLEEKKKRQLKDTSSHRAKNLAQITWRHQLADFVDWGPFQVACMLVIVANALHIFIQADAKMVNAYKTALEGGTPMENVHYLDVFFATWFAMELTMRILPDGFFYFFWESEDRQWNIFDTVVTMEAVLGLFVRLMVSSASGLRILGVFRIFRLVKHMDWHKGLRKLRKTLMALVGSLMDLIWAFLVVVLCLVTYSVFLSTATVGYFESFGHTRLVLLTSDEQLEVKRVLDEFGTVPTTMLSLWSAISGGNDWMGYAETLRIMDKQDIFFGTFVVFTAFCVIGLFNVVTGVFVDSAVEASKSFRSNVEVIEEHKDQEKQEKMEEANLLKLLSTSAGKDLTYKELLEHLDIDSAEAFWQTNMELSGDKVKDIYLLYHRLKKSKEDEKVKPLEIEDKQDPDYEQKVFKVSVKEFLAFTRRCKGTASYVDLLTMMHDNTRLEKFIRNEFKDLKERLPGEAKDAKK